MFHRNTFLIFGPKFVLASAVFLASLSTGAAQPQAPATPKPEPMRVMLVREPAASCIGPCREWISAEGDLVTETPREFERVIRQLGDRKVPIFIHSRGGRVDAALAIGRMLRARGFDIAIARTSFEGCGIASSACPPVPAKPPSRRDKAGKPPAANPPTTNPPALPSGTFGGQRALCASACVYLIAGGHRRAAMAGSSIGVHQITTTQTHVMRHFRVRYMYVDGRRVEIGREHLRTTTLGQTKFQPTAGSATYRNIKVHLEKLGVSPELVDLGMKAGPETLHFLNYSDVQRTRLIDPMIKLDELFQPARVLLAQGKATLLPGSNSTITVDIEASMRDPKGLIEMAFQLRLNDRLHPNPIVSVLTLYRSDDAERTLLAMPQTGDTISAPVRAFITKQQFCGMMKEGINYMSFDFRTRAGLVSSSKNQPKLDWSKTPVEQFCAPAPAVQAKASAPKRSPKSGVAAPPKRAR